MAIIVDMEAVISGVVLEIGDERGDIDDSQEPHTAMKLTVLAIRRRLVSARWTATGFWKFSTRQQPG